MQILVKTPFSSYTLNVEPSKTLRSVFGNNPFYSQGQLYRPSQQFNELPEDAVVCQLHPTRGGMQIFVRQLSGKTIALDLPSEDPKVEEIKRLIHERENISEQTQALYCAGKQMMDGHNIAEYGIVAETVVHLIVNMSQVPAPVVNQAAVGHHEEVEAFQIMIQNMNKDQIMLDLPNGENTSVADLKQMLHDKKGMDKAQITLYYSGKPLDEYSTLKTHGIPNSSVLTLVLQVK